MTIRRFTASADSTITNAFRSNLTNRGNNANLGASDILEVFSIYAQASTSSLEAARILINFNTDSIQSERNNQILPTSGNVNFVLKLFNAPHQETLPENFTLQIAPVSSSWTEGYGLDMENYRDLSISGNHGVTWDFAQSALSWSNSGGDYLTASNTQQTFTQGFEDLEVDITDIVEQWLNNDYSNNGLGIFLSSSQENAQRSYYTKRFFARGSEFVLKRPFIEARWNDNINDDRGRFYLSSTTAPASDNLNTIYFFNYVRQRLTDIPSVGTGQIFVELYDSREGGTQLTATPNNPVTGGWVNTGIYSASFALDTTSSVVYDRWTDGTNYFLTGQIETKNMNECPFDYYVSAIENLKEKYSTSEDVRFRLFLREKNWRPNIYSIAQSEPERVIAPNMFYKIFRSIDGFEVIGFGTGSTQHTKLSYDVSGNYFDLDLSLFQPGFQYKIAFLIQDGNRYFEPASQFVFRVENDVN